MLYKHLNTIIKVSNKVVARKNLNARREASRDVAKEYVYQYLLQHPCTDCGEGDPLVLEFDHVGEGNKITDISRMVSGGWSVPVIKDEIEKCEVCCANCHRRRTLTRGKCWTWRRQQQPVSPETEPTDAVSFQD